MSFPPIPTYPLAIDDDYTLFLVHNTSEAKTRSNNLPWSQEVEIEPVGADELEIWADNGFANISGELFYYDSVGKDSNGKVNSLKRCSRNIHGTRTKFNKSGSWVRGFVVAEHHNQIVGAILKIENFVGINFDTKKETLDFRIRHLNALSIIEDDHACPDITLEYKILTTGTGETGTLISYNLIINGFFKSFRLEFGDGNFTASNQTGTHLYAPNASIDPIVTVSNDTCQMVQTGVIRENPKEPQIEVPTSGFEIDVPEPPEFPPIVIPNIDTPQTTLTLPQINFPFELGFNDIGISGISINVPSIIMLEPPIPSVIMLEPPIPSVITVDWGDAPSISVSFDDAPSITVTFDDPPSITVTFDDPPSITVSWDDPPSIIMDWDDPPSFTMDWDDVPSFTMDWGDPPSITVDWGDTPIIGPIEFATPPIIGPIEFATPPVIEVVFGPLEVLSITVPNITGTISGPSNISIEVDWGTPPIVPVIFGDAPIILVDFGDVPDVMMNWGDPPSVTMDWGTPPGISVDWGEPPTCSCTMTVTCPGAAAANARAASFDDSFQDPFLSVEMDNSAFAIPNEINLIVPKIPNISLIHDLPTVITVEVPTINDIRIIGPENQIPSEINIFSDIPSIINVFSDIPSIITVDYSNMPTVIRVEFPEFPDLKIDSSTLSTIQVTGIPDTIELKGNIPSEIIIKMQENLEIPLVYKGGAIPVQFDFSTPSGSTGNEPCFKLIPCGN